MTADNSNTLHRFTPPTCTLEIKGKKSLLSQWADRDLLKDFKFKLSFDDPRLSSDKQVIITGDRLDLEQLTTAVDRYTRENVYGSFSNNKNSKQQHNLERNMPYLNSQGLTNHELFFGNLSHDSDRSKMILSTVQLFDLVTALEACESQIKVLPELKQKQFNKIVPLWGGIAAAVVAAVGVTAVWLQSSPVRDVASNNRDRPEEATPQFDDVISPETPSGSRRNPQLKTTESIAGAKRLPPPPAVSTPKPKPNIPDPADYPLSQVGRQSGLKQPKKEAEQAESVISALPKTIPKAERIELETKPNSESNSAKSENDVALSTTKPLEREIEAYFQDKWQPPADLKQSLEYRLYINADGSIKKVVPIGKASEIYLDRTNIPVKGENFVSPLADSQKTVRLLLNPDGKIVTLIE